MTSKDDEKLVHWPLTEAEDSPWARHAACDMGLRPMLLTRDAEAITCPVCREVCSLRVAGAIERFWGRP